MKEKHPRDVFKERNLAPHSKWGQNFLVSTTELDRVAESAELEPSDVVLEIGAGMGRLTRRLAQKAGRVVAVEIDEGLCKVAFQHLSGMGNVLLLQGDVLQDKHHINPKVAEKLRGALDETGGELKVVSNLPYWISSPVVVSLLELEMPLAGMYVLVQAEVADRMTAEPGGKQYGPLTVMVDHWARAEKLFDLPPHAFWPQPEVDSTFISLLPEPVEPGPESYEMFSETVNKLFQCRRKMLRKGLKIGWGKEIASQVLERVDVAGTLRPEKLSTADFIAVANALTRLNCTAGEG